MTGYLISEKFNLANRAKLWELREAQPPEVNQDIPLTRQAIVRLANIMGSGSSEGYALACSDIAVIVERNVIRFPGVHGESKVPALNEGDNPSPISQLRRMAEEEDKQDITIPMGNPYPIVLADWNHRGAHYQAWNQQERLWIVIERMPVNDAMGWELLWSL